MDYSIWNSKGERTELLFNKRKKERKKEDGLIDKKNGEKKNKKSNKWNTSWLMKGKTDWAIIRGI